MSIGCSCLEFVTLGSAFLCFGREVEFDLLDGLISSGVVFDLGECSDICACLQRLVARKIARLMRAFTNPLTTE
jgi:hypothetical protein